ncbi:uncharacterized protein PG986_011371 [Apiospora aurea]|uniref:Uncharacterized protein n=1 Tax=Apiospora aurea TaxID=335848 RepID=A0ABR1Q538_9PEZI
MFGSEVNRLTPLCRWEPMKPDDPPELVDSSVRMLRTRAQVTRTASILPRPEPNWMDMNRSGMGRLRYGDRELALLNVSAVGLEGMSLDDRGLMLWTDADFAYTQGQPCELIALASFVPYRNSSDLEFTLLDILFQPDRYLCPGRSDNQGEKRSTTSWR